MNFSVHILGESTSKVIFNQLAYNTTMPSFTSKLFYEVIIYSLLDVLKSHLRNTYVFILRCLFFKCIANHELFIWCTSQYSPILYKINCLIGCYSVLPNRIHFRGHHGCISQDSALFGMAPDCIPRSLLPDLFRHFDTHDLQCEYSDIAVFRHGMDKHWLPLFSAELYLFPNLFIYMYLFPNGGFVKPPLKSRKLMSNFEIMSNFNIPLSYLLKVQSGLAIVRKIITQCHTRYAYCKVNIGHILSA